MRCRHVILISRWAFLSWACGFGCTRSVPAQSSHGSDTASVQPSLEGDSNENAVDLVAFDEWEILDLSQDPFPDHRQAQHTCDPSGILPEENVLEINTNDCGYALVGQPMLEPVTSGDTVELLMYHSALSSIEAPAEAHFSLFIGEQPFWDITIDIPWQSEVYLVPIQIDWDAEAGTMVRVHLHNHGGNSWRVAYLRRIPSR